jgi:type IV secretion system protein VirB10
MTSAAKYSDNYSATRRPDSTITAPVSACHLVSYTDTYSRYTDTGHHLLVPQGATIGGRDHSSELLYGNERLPTTSLALTIGKRTYDLGQAPMMDQVGTNGLTGEVDQHYWRLFGAIFIGGALRGGQQMLQMEMAQAGGAGQMATGIAGLGNQAASQRIGRALDTRPTIKVFAGQQCQVLLIKELKLPAVWQTPTR